VVRRVQIGDARLMPGGDAVRVGDTLVNEELLRQGLAWVSTRYCDRVICQEWKKIGGTGTGNETRPLVNAECGAAMGVSERWKIRVRLCLSSPQLPMTVQ
jgi:hypothetical protein